jgi:hypothetical protein
VAVRFLLLFRNLKLILFWRNQRLGLSSRSVLKVSRPRIICYLLLRRVREEQSIVIMMQRSLKLSRGQNCLNTRLRSHYQGKTAC